MTCLIVDWLIFQTQLITCLIVDWLVFQTQLITCLIMMFKMMDERHYESLFASLDKREQMKNFLLMVFNVFEMLVKTDVYSKEWIVMRMVTNRCVLNTTKRNQLVFERERNLTER